MQLRWYQSESVDAAFASARRGKHPCIVLPTGAGKSLVIAELCRQAVENWQGRVLVLAHRKELLTQNADKIQKLLPQHEIGIYSAGLKSRQGDQDIVVAGIQSVFKRADELGIRHLVIVDESHLIPESGDGMYRKLINDLQIIFPRCRIIGLTATPFRLDCGLITDGGVLDEICYEASVARLMAEGFLCRVTNRPTHQVDMSGVRKSRGDFVQQQMEERFLSSIDGNVKEALELLAGRRSVLWFCSGVSHANRVANQLEKLGELAVVVTGETMPLLRNNLLESFSAGRLRHLVNCDVLTTGFDAPRVDAIAVLRATESAGLFAQICGRGFRIHESKQDCLILDFGGNIGRHGPLDDPLFGRTKQKRRSSGEEILTPQKTCEQCDGSCATGCVWCPHCGAEFPRTETAVEDSADTNSALLSEDVQPEWFVVESAIASRHTPRDIRKQDSMRVEYRIENADLVVICEWVCIEHDGFALRKANDWWRTHTNAEFVADISEAVRLFDCGAFRVPRRIKCIREGRFWKIINREFEDDAPESWDEEPQPVPFDLDDEDIPF